MSEEAALSRLASSPISPRVVVAARIARVGSVIVFIVVLKPIVRDFIYLYIGYAGISAATEIIEGIEGVSSIVTTLLGLIGVGIFGYIVYRKYFIKPKNDQEV